jgi:hypothetical protein
MRMIVRNNVLAGGISIILGMILLLFHEWMPAGIVVISAIAIAAGALFVIIGWLQSRGTIGMPDTLDERVLKIRAHTFMKAYLFSFTVLCVLGIVNFSGLLVMSSRSVIEILFLTMGLSAFVLSWYYNRQGDVSEE